MYENCKRYFLNFMTSHSLRYYALYSRLLQVNTKRVHFSYLKDILIGKQRQPFLGNKATTWFAEVCEVSCWHMKIIIRVLATSAQKANKICLKYHFSDAEVQTLTLPVRKGGIGMTPQWVFKHNSA